MPRMVQGMPAEGMLYLQEGTGPVWSPGEIIMENTGFATVNFSSKEASNTAEGQFPPSLSPNMRVSGGEAGVNFSTPLCAPSWCEGGYEAGGESSMVITIRTNFV